MRIACFQGTMPAPGSKPGGVGIFVDRLATELTRAGHDVELFTYSTGMEPREYPVTIMGPRRARTSSAVRQYVAPWLLNARPRLDRFDVAHLHGEDWFFLRRTIPTLRTFHGSAIFEAATATSWKRRINSSILFGLEILAGSRADAVYAVGSESQTLFNADGILRLGIHLDDPSPADERDPATILFVGTWEGRKRGRFLRDVFVSEVRPRFPEARLIMVSDRAEEGDGVELVHGPTDDELAALYRQATLYCSVSRYEGMGIPYIEAMAHGAPVVATPNPGAIDVLVGGRYGCLIDESEVGETLAGLLGDPARRAELSSTGRTRAEEFAWPKVIGEYEQGYRLAAERFAASRS